MDSSKSAVSNAKQNVAMSETTGKVRWIVDDCLTFINREVRRVQETNSLYDGLIFDPPAFGRSKDKKTWQINRDFPILLETIPKLLSPQSSFVLITSHDQNWPADLIENRLFNIMKNAHIYGHFMKGKLLIKCNIDGKDNSLEVGQFVRWSRLPMIEK